MQYFPLRFFGSLTPGVRCTKLAGSGIRSYSSDIYFAAGGVKYPAGFADVKNNIRRTDGGSVGRALADNGKRLSRANLLAGALMLGWALTTAPAMLGQSAGNQSQTQAAQDI